jgi:hypothetical protein
MQEDCNDMRMRIEKLIQSEQHLLRRMRLRAKLDAIKTVTELVHMYPTSDLFFVMLQQTQDSLQRLLAESVRSDD